jgi:hypothetical protein
MRDLINQRATYAFGALVLVTATAYWLTVGHGAASMGETPTVVWTEVIVLAGIKVRWILMDFMELRSSPPKVRALFETWVAALAAGLICIAWLAH